MISSSTKKLLSRIFAFLAVMLVGALVFFATEGKNQTTKPKDVDFQKMYNISKQDYDLLLDSVRNDTTPSVAKLPWTFGNSLYFVLVLITTIGYGHLYPETWQGQVFCIFFSLVGIPVTALMLKSVGEFIAKAITISLSAFERRVLTREPENLERKCFIASIVLMIFMLLGGAVFAKSSEDWTMMEGIYFTFVTLSTIGFGDYVVNDGGYVHETMTKTLVTQINLVFLILGLGVVSSVLCSISKLLESGGFRCFKRGGGEDIRNEAPTSVAEIKT